MRVACVMALLLAGAAGSAQAEKFLNGGWLCTSAEAHAGAVRDSQGVQGADLEALKNRLHAEHKCFWLDDTELQQIVTGVRVHETQGDAAHVSFGMQRGDQMPGEVRQERFYRMFVWTARANLSNEDEAEAQ